MLVQTITLGALVRLWWYRRVLQEHWLGCAGMAYYRSTREAVLVLHSTVGALGRVFWYTREEMLVQQSTIESLGWLCWYNRVQLEHLEGCVGTVEYYRRIRVALLVHTSITGEMGRLC